MLRQSVLTGCCLALAALCAGCSSGTTGYSGVDGASQGCASILSFARSRVSELASLEEFNNPPSNELAWAIDDLRTNCPDEFATFSDEVRAKAERLSIAGQDGPSISAAFGDLPWNEAKENIGNYETVCGPLAGTGSSQDDVFLDLGREYPDSGRFTIVIWDVGGVEYIAPGTTLCVTGEIINYRGTPQIQVRSAGAVEIRN